MGVKKAVNLQVEKNIFIKFKVVCIKKDKYMGEFLEEMMRQEIDKWEKENGVIQTE